MDAKEVYCISPGRLIFAGGKTTPGLRGLWQDYEILEVGAGAQAPALAEYEAGIRLTCANTQGKEEESNLTVQLQVCHPFFWLSRCINYTEFFSNFQRRAVAGS